MLPNSRHMGIEIHRGNIDTDVLTELQNNTLRASWFTSSTTFRKKSWMTQPWHFKERFSEYRGKSQNSNHHKRFAEAIACLQIGWETLLDFLNLDCFAALTITKVEPAMMKRRFLELALAFRVDFQRGLIDIKPHGCIILMETNNRDGAGICVAACRWFGGELYGMF